MGGRSEYKGEAETSESIKNKWGAKMEKTATPEYGARLQYFASALQSIDNHLTAGRRMSRTEHRCVWNGTKKKEKMHSFLLGWSHSSFGVVSQFDKLVSPIALG